MNKLIFVYINILFGLELTFSYSNVFLNSAFEYSSIRFLVGSFGMLILLLVWIRQTKKNNIGKYELYYFIKLILAFIILIIFNTLLNNPDQIINVLTVSIKRWSIIVMIGILIIQKYENINSIKLLFIIQASIVTVSSIVAIMQYYDYDIAWLIRIYLGGFNDLEIAKQVYGKGRVMGLSWYAIPFAYSLATIIPVLFSILIYEKKIVIKYYLWLCLSIMITALLLNQTRSAIIGVLVGIVFILFQSGKRTYALWIISILVIVTTIFGIAQDTSVIRSLQNRFSYKEDVQTIGRIPLYLFSILKVASNPLGINDEYNEDIIFDKNISNYEYSENIQIIAPHNQILTSADKYGWIAIIIIIGLYSRIYQYLKYSVLSSDSNISQSISLGLYGSFLSYLICSMFHNAGLLSGHVMHWTMIYLIIANYNYVKKERSTHENYL
jgi:hypothetical protein